jgi:hypothetical protein
MEDMSWLIGFTDNKKEIRLFKNIRDIEKNRDLKEYTDLDHFQCCCALEAKIIDVIRMFGDNSDELYQVLHQIEFHKSKIAFGNYELLKHRLSLNTSVQIVKYGRHFIL